MQIPLQLLDLNLVTVPARGKHIMFTILCPTHITLSQTAPHCLCVSLTAIAGFSINKMAAGRANQNAFFDRVKRACPLCSFSTL